jgi:hypothetical protein
MADKQSKARRIPLLNEYAWGWCLHQLVPFMDKMLGVAGAMDHRMIDRDYDWYIRLPLTLLCAAFPNRNILLVGHVVNVVCWFDRMPAVWDYMCWCALMETTFVFAALVSSTNEELAKKILACCASAARGTLLFCCLLEAHHVLVRFALLMHISAHV